MSLRVDIGPLRTSNDYRHVSLALLVLIRILSDSVWVDELVVLWVGTAYTLQTIQLEISMQTAAGEAGPNTLLSSAFICA